MMITVQAPASKSVSHRMVMGAALAQGDSVVSRVLESKDLERTMAILRGAGAGIVRTGEGEYAISGVGGQPHGGSVDPLSCDVHESGTTYSPPGWGVSASTERPVCTNGPLGN